MVQIAEPPRSQNADGEPRRVGVEIEFSGLPIEIVAAITKLVLGGDHHPIKGHSTEIIGSSIGKIEIMLDTRIAHMGSKANTMERVKKLGSEVIGHMVKPVTPLEIITEPIPFEALAELDKLAEALNSEGAKGTDESILFAYGVHLNPEIAVDDTDWILAIMKAFGLANPVLRDIERVDFTRDAMGWIRPWSEAYLSKLLDPDYWPDRNTMIGDYLALAGNRNADLDMLPLFHHLDSKRVERAVEDELVNGRPAFHYRMPNTVFEEGVGLVVSSWNRWVAVERLAEERTQLDALCRVWLDRKINDDAYRNALAGIRALVLAENT